MKNICVFLGSSPGRHEEYAEVAQQLGRELVNRGYGLVYGGANVGLMGVLADTVLEAGGHVTGVMPKFLVAKEVAHTGLSDLRTVESMHERKALMADLSEAFIAMPGGLGTLEEIFEVYTWSQLGMHPKPCGLLNVRGYYDKLGVFLTHAVEEGFIRSEHQAMLHITEDPTVMLESFANYKAPKVVKWLAHERS